MKKQLYSKCQIFRLNKRTHHTAIKFVWVFISIPSQMQQFYLSHAGTRTAHV